METLRNLRQKIDEDKLFDIIEALDIKTKEYMLEIQNQSWAQKKCQVFQSLFLE
jgi:hypothetical protein